MTHCAQSLHDETQQKHLDDIIAYIKSRNVDIVTMQQAIERRGNIVDTGIYNRDEKLKIKEHFVVGADGVNSTGMTQSYTELKPDNFIVNATLPRSLTKGKVYINKVLPIASSGMPESAAGILTTNTSNLSSDVGYISQTYYVFNTSNVYVRNAVQGTDTWSEWKPLNPATKFLAINTGLSTTPITTFEANKLSINAVQGGSANGFPDNKAGTLTTYRMKDGNHWSYQEYQIYGTNQKYYRGHDGTNWLAWEPLFNTNKVMVANANLNDKPLSEFELNRITINTVNGANANGFPGNKAGMLHTYRLSTDSGYCYQEYHCHSTNEKWIRGHNGTTWLTWAQMH